MFMAAFYGSLPEIIFLVATGAASVWSMMKIWAAVLVGWIRAAMTTLLAMVYSWLVVEIVLGGAEIAIDVVPALSEIGVGWF
jgi:hypothetical protein